MLKFFIDTNCELWYDKATEIEANVIRMPYTVDNEQFYYDLGKETNFKEFYTKLRQGKSAITSALNEFEYFEYFEPYFKNGDDIFYASFSHKMSATFESLRKAQAELEEKYKGRKITLFDTKKISLGAGLPIYFAGKHFQKEPNIQSVSDYLARMLARTHTYFTVDNLMYLKRGGRLSATQAVLGTALNIKPLIRFSEGGTLESFKKAKGLRGSIKFMIDQLIAELDTDYPIAILDADNFEAAEQMHAEVLEAFPNAIVWRQSIGPVIGTHCGPGTVGICFIGKVPS